MEVSSSNPTAALFFLHPRLGHIMQYVLPFFSGSARCNCWSINLISFGVLANVLTYLLTSGNPISLLATAHVHLRIVLCRKTFLLTGHGPTPPEDRIGIEQLTWI